MARFFEFEDYRGIPVCIDLDRIAKVMPAIPDERYPKMRTIVILFEGEEGFIALNQSYDDVKIMLV